MYVQIMYTDYYIFRIKSNFKSMKFPLIISFIPTETSRKLYKFFNSILAVWMRKNWFENNNTSMLSYEMNLFHDLSLFPTIQMSTYETYVSFSLVDTGT